MMPDEARCFNAVNFGDWRRRSRCPRVARYECHTPTLDASRVFTVQDSRGRRLPSEFTPAVFQTRAEAHAALEALHGHAVVAHERPRARW